MTDSDSSQDGLNPTQLSGEFVFVTEPAGSPLSADLILASVTEPEGRSLVVTRESADLFALSYDFVGSWITLSTETSLNLVGLTARVSSALADAGIACNVIAGHHHDHLLVPIDRTEETLKILEDITVPQ